MSNVTYKVLDEKGRITIPREMRAGMGLAGGDVVRVAWSGEKSEIIISKADVLDYEKGDPEMLEACIYAAVRTMPRERKVALEPMAEEKR